MCTPRRWSEHPRATDRAQIFNGGGGSGTTDAAPIEVRMGGRGYNEGGTKGKPKILTPQIGQLEKRLRNGWRKRQITLVGSHKARH
jgi:hypothetical protein